MITWSPVPEEDMRGFLQGYIISYIHDNSKRSESGATFIPGTTLLCSKVANW